MSDAQKQEQVIDIKQSVSSIINSIEQDREKEIITRRFGLYERKETLEQIGELLGITRERVRQLEKAVLIRIKMAAERGDIEDVAIAEKALIRMLSDLGRISRTTTLANVILDKNANYKERAHITFLAEIAPNLTVLNENDSYYESVAISEYGNEKKIKSEIDEIVKTIKSNKKPISLEDLHQKLNYEHPKHVEALAKSSKLLANLKDMWGLAKWPEVNPKNIRDKIYVVLCENGKPMHFSEIAEEIKNSNFNRKDVTKQAIHNELIKDSRFVLIGRGIYALDSWGFKQGTVADAIEATLIKAGQPMHRDDIIREVLKKRQVKETTILLNLQSKPQFKRVAKATYSFEPVK